MFRYLNKRKLLLVEYLQVVDCLQDLLCIEASTVEQRIYQVEARSARALKLRGAASAAHLYLHGRLELAHRHYARRRHLHRLRFNGHLSPSILLVLGLLLPRDHLLVLLIGETIGYVIAGHASP